MPMVSRPKQPDQAVTPRETQILEAARDLLAEGGLQGMSMRSVAVKTGISATAIYHYFTDKQALVDRVVEIGFQRFHEHLSDAIDPQPAGSLEKLMALAEAYVRFAFENQEYFRVIYSIKGSNSRAFEDLPSHGGYDLLRTCVEEGINSGVIQSGDPVVISTYLWSVIHGVVMLAMTSRVRCDERSMPGDEVKGLLSLIREFAPLIGRGLMGGNLDDGHTHEKYTREPAALVAELGEN